ncbi:c-type cytochrome [Amantichitinum ursilacus]|uniref:Cytochrome c-551 n=1 Tax=Amantichitinum ursilacus TaxID=857265 RepID=A0A0N0XMK7_9NEIS|nr:c-type cytochrome [Amantichitinum ursilacus]KPC55176.1 Cytochrome c-551 precursor [Amantichitinum ursilacus]
MNSRYLALLLLAGLAAPALAADPEALAQSKNCLACHAVDHKVVGPAYKDVAAKYKGRKDAVAYLVGRVRNGSSGDWGPVPMPANAVTDDEAKQLVTWVLSRK